MKDIVKDFGIVYGSMIGAMLAFAGAAEVGGNDTGVGVCVGLATIAAAMYAASIVVSAAIELVVYVKEAGK